MQGRVGPVSQSGKRDKFISSEEFMPKDMQQRERDKKIVDAYKKEFGEFQGFKSIKFDSGANGAQKANPNSNPVKRN